MHHREDGAPRLEPQRSPALEWLVERARRLKSYRRPARASSIPSRLAAAAPVPLVGILLWSGILVLGGRDSFGALRDGAVDAGGPVDQASEPPCQRRRSRRRSPRQVQPAPAARAFSPAAEETEEDVPEAQPPKMEQRLVESITTYYALVPGELESAWPMMTADYQENHVGGRDAYDFFWGGTRMWPSPT